MRKPLAMLLTCQHYELQAWSCKTEALASQIAEQAWQHMESGLQGIWDRSCGCLPAQLVHHIALQWLATAFESACDQRIAQHIAGMVHAVQAAGASRWQWHGRPAHMSLAHLQKQLPYRLDAVNRAPGPGQLHAAFLAARSGMVQTMRAAALAHMRSAVHEYQQALADLRKALAQQPEPART